MQTLRPDRGRVCADLRGPKGKSSKSKGRKAGMMGVRRIEQEGWYGGCENEGWYDGSEKDRAERLV